MNKFIDQSWQSVMADEFNKPYFLSLQKKIKEDREAGNIILPCPAEPLVYRAFDLTPLWKVKVVILGEEPYSDIKDASGIAFSAPNTREAPKNLKNIFRELKSDLGIVNEYSDLSYWATQGVLLLNSVLTTTRGKTGAHKRIGWETFTDEAIKNICKYSKYTVFWLLGKESQGKEKLIKMNSKEGSYHLIKLPYPSPEVAHTGFFWSKPFSKTNELLKQNGLQEIDWRT